MSQAAGGQLQPPGAWQTVKGLLVSIIAGLLFIALLWAMPRFLHLGPQGGMDRVCADLKCRSIEVDSAVELEAALRRYDLLEGVANHPVPPLLFDRIPADLVDVKPVARRKNIFFHTLLPISLIARQEILFERGFLLDILSKYPHPQQVVFDENDDNTGDLRRWQQKLDRTEIRRIIALSRKYKSRRAAELLRRIRPVPISLVLAQAALESAWGGSRFAREGNNLFGIWTWDDGDEGLVPKRREKGRTHRVKSFKSILAAVREYCLLLNSQPAYAIFRSLRQKADDSIIMAAGLKNYSSRRSLYVRDVRNVIRSNKLNRYDHCELQGAAGRGGG